MNHLEKIPKETSLSIVKKARKQVEEDARLLANRIALLKQEELRTIKKINETTRKAMEIYKIKEQNERKWFQQNRELQELKNQKRDMYVNHSEEIKEKSELRKKRLNDVLSFKKHQTSETKKELEEQNAIREDYLNKLAEQNHQKFKDIRKQRIEGKQKINKFLCERKEFFKKENKKEILNESKVKNEKMEEISKLEISEMTLIDKLKNTQQNQTLAYEKLENAIKLPPQEFKKKYEEEIFKKKENEHIKEENIKEKNVELSENSKEKNIELPENSKEKNIEIPEKNTPNK